MNRSRLDMGSRTGEVEIFRLDLAAIVMLDMILLLREQSLAASAPKKV